MTEDSTHSLLSEDVYADSVYLTLPQTWVIPDPDFQPRTSVLPLYPGSYWMQYFKSTWGPVTSASIVFGNLSDGEGNVGLVVKFREVKALRQCFSSLFEKTLVHPKEGHGEIPVKIKLVRYSTVAVKKKDLSSSLLGGSASNFPAQSNYGIRNPHQEAVSAAAAYSNSKDIPLTVAEAFQHILERVEKLDRENQRLLSLLVENDDSTGTPESEGIRRERSPRGSAREIPSDGLPPWRQH